MRALIIPSNLNSTPSSSANCCISGISWRLMLTATVLSLSGRPRSMQQANAAHAAIERARHAGQPFVGLARASVEGDLDGERAPLGQHVGDLRRDLRAVGEQRHQEAAALRVLVDLHEVAAGEDLTAGEQQPEAARLGHLVDDPADLDGRQLARARAGVADGEVVVAVRAGERTAVGELDGAVGGEAAAAGAPVDLRAEVAVAPERGVHGETSLTRPLARQQLDEFLDVGGRLGLADLVLARERDRQRLQRGPPVDQFPDRGADRVEGEDRLEVADAAAHRHDDDVVGDRPADEAIGLARESGQTRCRRCSTHT